MSYFILLHNGRSEAIRRDGIIAISVIQVQHGLHLVLDVNKKETFSQTILSNYKGEENLPLLCEKVLYYVLYYPRERNIDTDCIQKFIKDEIENLQGEQDIETYIIPDLDQFDALFKHKGE